MFDRLYLLASWLGWFVALIALSIAALFKPNLRAVVLRRLLLIGNLPFTQSGVWIHCASFGEARAIEPIIKSLPPTMPINITVATKSGFDEVKRRYTQAQARFLPFENFLPFWIRRQDTLIVFDAELWFALFAYAKKCGATTMLINARVPANRLGRYRRLRWFYRRVFRKIDFIYAQSDADRDRLIALDAKNALTLGNIKLLQQPQTTRNFAKPNALTIVAASTHEGEEALILRAWIKSAIGGRLFIVPRHPERFDAVWKEILTIAKEGDGSNALSAARFSELNALGDAKITLIDAMGLLIDLYAIADIVALGGAFAPKGGHNPIEAAHFGARIITGEHIFHQKALFAEISGAIFSSSERLAESLKQALTAPKTAIKGAVDREAFESALKNVC
ncbi:MAG: 3-deoxy-D-manno-octulosonic acid transferase [Helicobacteraceae bacterium]|jgi:3-deoxy-D-manno-octulosonic-acid transferase|nr:3-deoxy-D-manno-octulosonic acid transferase [Helicobacteraceae bacterium]